MATHLEIGTVDSYERRRAEQLAEFDRINPPMAAMLRELDALYLFGTIGYEAAMRPDGSVIVRIDEDWPNPQAAEPVWRAATPAERSLSIVAASERWPEFARLLPARPLGARDCPACKGAGTYLGEIFCGDCGARGWIDDAAI